MGLAIGFILGGAVSKVVGALVTDIVNPIVGLLLGNATGLAEATIKIGKTKILLGHFASVVIDFLVVAAVVYFGFKKLRLDRLDIKEEKK